MTLLKKFNETGQEIASDDVPIDETNFPQAIEQYGKDWANGYNAAFADIIKAIGEMFFRTDEYGESGNSRQIVGRKTEIFHKEKSLALEKMARLLSDPKLKS